MWREEENCCIQTISQYLYHFKIRNLNLKSLLELSEGCTPYSQQSFLGLLLNTILVFSKLLCILLLAQHKLLTGINASKTQQR